MASFYLYYCFLTVFKVTWNNNESYVFSVFASRRVIRLHSLTLPLCCISFKVKAEGV